MEFKMTFRKLSQKTLNLATANENILGIIERGLASKRASWGWTCSHKIDSPLIRGESKVYLAHLTFKKERESDRDESQMEEIIKIACQAAASHGKWSFIPSQSQTTKVETTTEVKDDEEEYDVEVQPKIQIKSVEKPSEFPEIQTELGNNFDGIYDRDAQIQIIHSAIVAFKTSKKINKFHTVLYGEPACGKTQILESFYQTVGEDVAKKIDATSSTQAGIQKMLTDKSFRASILIIEEIEKAEEKALRFLLALLDQRSEVRKITFRSNLDQRVDVLCLATVNDMEMFGRVMSGALASRFSNKLYCPRPSLEILRKILTREVIKVNGNEKWIDPTIEYCEEKGIRDPRTATTICLCGQDKLLNGTYQEYLKKVEAPNPKKS